MSNEKHDALYSSARVVLNSNVKRLWFNVNPFLEKKPTLTGTPEPPSKFIQPLQSTLVCEKYLQDCSCGNIDIQIGKVKCVGHCSNSDTRFAKIMEIFIPRILEHLEVPKKLSTFIHLQMLRHVYI